MNKHASAGSKALIKEESELGALLDKIKIPLILILDCIQYLYEADPNGPLALVMGSEAKDKEWLKHALHERRP